mgnify:CR=1 FL=1
MITTTERTLRAENPEDHSMTTDRFDATWGVPRTAASVYETYYKNDIEAEQQTYIEYSVLSASEQTKRAARGWAKKKYPKLDQDEISQEIELKAWQLEEAGHLNERSEWVQPAYVMQSLKNAVHDYARAEIGFEKAHAVTDEVIVRTRFESIDAEVQFTNKTLKAGLLLFVAAPSTLSVLTKDAIYRVYRRLSRAEHAALIQMILEPTDAANKTMNKAVAKYLDTANA